MGIGRNDCLGLLALIFAATATSAPASAQQQKPNILVIMADDIGYWEHQRLRDRPKRSWRSIWQAFKSSARKAWFDLIRSLGSTRSILIEESGHNHDRK